MKSCGSYALFSVLFSKIFCVALVVGAGAICLLIGEGAGVLRMVVRVWTGKKGSEVAQWIMKADAFLEGWKWER